MALTHVAPFAQSGKTAQAVVTTAVTGLDGTSPANTVELLEAGEDGALLTRLTAIPRATVTASSLLLWIEKDGSTDKYLKDSVLMAPHTVETTTAIPVTTFSRYTEDTPLRLEAGDKLYVGTAVTGNIAFNGNYTDF
jgi:hypothetical protein